MHFLKSNFLHCKIVGLALLFMFSRSATADDHDLDTQLRLNQNIEQQNNSKESELLKDEDYLSEKRPELILDGKSYTVGHNANDIGRALYVSIKQKQWNAVVYFLDEYRTLSDADPLLLAYAKGALARIQGNMEQAATEYRQLLGLNPEFLPGQLELARVLFEDHQDKEAEVVFTQISAKLDPDNEQQTGVYRTVESFRKALEQRRDWSTSIALGAVWNDNLNQSSESRTCLLLSQGQCIYERKIPDAISATGLDYELT
ncbi:MAG: peptide signal, partial [Gammaproteobacteria bacterium]|nr:peptide signal [Gammaproteobacteria bacterium]